MRSRLIPCLDATNTQAALVVPATLNAFYVAVLAVRIFPSDSAESAYEPLAIDDVEISL